MPLGNYQKLKLSLKFSRLTVFFIDLTKNKTSSQLQGTMNIKKQTLKIIQYIHIPAIQTNRKQQLRSYEQISSSSADLYPVYHVVYWKNSRT